MLFFQKTRLYRQKRERRLANSSNERVKINEKETFRLLSLNKPAIPTEKPALSDFIFTLKFNINYKENGENDNKIKKIEKNENIIRKIIQFKELNVNTQLSGPT
jgi:hypothetical protein